MHVAVWLCVDEVPDSLEKVVDETLMGQFAGDLWYLSDDLSDVWLDLIDLYEGELVCGGPGDLEEGLAGHLHNAWVLFFHELE